MSRIKSAVLLLALVAGGVHAEESQAQKCKESKMIDWSSRLTDNGNGTVTDSKTNLTWMKCSLGMEWSGKECTKAPINVHLRDVEDELDEFRNDGGFAGKSDWRLPTKQELESILETACESPAISIDYFSFTPSSFFWTTSGYEQNDKWFWVVGFLYGGSYLAHRRDAWMLRLVR